MAKPSEPLSIKIEPGRVDGRRFWWSVYAGPTVVARSSVSYATRREAELVASAEVLKGRANSPQSRENVAN